MTQKKIFSLLWLWLLCLPIFAQMQNPVHFSVSQKKVSPSEIEIIFTGKIGAGWHVYSTDLPNSGPISATFHLDKSKGVVKDGKLKAQGREIKKFDNIFGMELRFFEHSCTFVQKLKITEPTYNVSGYLEYGACNDENCLPPTSVEFSYSGKGTPAAGAAKAEAAAMTQQSGTPQNTMALDSVQTVNGEIDTTAVDSAAAATTVAPLDSASLKNLWQPVVKQLQQFGEDSTPTNESLFTIFCLGLLGGIIALFTPCVWPIIPMTVSFFLKRTKDKKKGIRDAWLYGLSIVVIYVALGLIITGLFGASALNSLATNAVFNIFFCLLLVVFAASFFGAFELTLPSKWSNKVDDKASSTGGLLSIFLMAFTLSLVSFSCTGPIIGFLLVSVSTSGNILAPTIGMLGFAIALALPFTLFAMFPAWLKSMPKSGGWMNNVKVVLGFVELAFALKFLSVADLAYGWHILDRETFLCLWIVLFALLGAYLMGWLRFPHDDEDVRHTTVPKFFLGLFSFAFSIYMIPGLWGAPLKAISAFAPPMNTQDFSLYKGEVTAKYKDYEQGMAYAKQVGKPVMIDFTGFGCVNCRKMEGAVWSDPRVSDIIQNDYVLIQLYVDDKTPLPEPMTVTENGQTHKLRTVGDKWSYLQRSKFGANAQPFYVLLDNEGMPLNKSYSYDEDIDRYLAFLNSGLMNYKK